ncbi:hypothetical protein ABRY23_10885 [Melioribacteraceae bacterium 4301-Me]|uniref:hypothetical protein n=1 Tax=Pyranulibacter aquaticus TaxID=3163344 RepID=UPI00359B37A9
MTNKLNNLLYKVIMLVLGSTASSFFAGIILTKLGVNSSTLLFVILYLILCLIFIGIVLFVFLYGGFKKFIVVTKNCYLKKTAFRLRKKFGSNP